MPLNSAVGGLAMIESVAMEVADGDCIGTAQLAKEKNLQQSTVFRWILKGLPIGHGNRVRLEAVKRGRTWLTSRAAVRRFFAALPTNAADDHPTVHRTASRMQPRHRAAEDAKAELKNRFDI
jgi:hypothetical protein